MDGQACPIARVALRTAGRGAVERPHAARLAALVGASVHHLHHVQLNRGGLVVSGRERRAACDEQ